MARGVIWSLPSELETADEALVRSFDAAIRQGEAGAAGRLACRLGCTGCCVGPFEITALDAARVVRGARALAARDPGAGLALIARASEQWGRMARAFPGDPETGVLTGDDAEREVFFARFGEAPCPALDPATGACLVYGSRPLSCRTYGLPVRHGGALLEPCPLNFAGASPETVTASTIEPDAADREGALLARAEALGLAGDTIVCAALAALP